MQEIALDRQFRTVARMGYISRGVIYLVIGGMALLAALGEGGGTTDSKGALLTILNQPFGSFLLGLLVLGLLGYSCWRLVQAFRDVDHHGTSATGLAVRAGLVVSAVTHALLAVWALNLLFGDAGASSGGQADKPSWINGDPGQIALGIAAIAVCGVGIAFIYRGWTARFERYMTIPPDKNAWLRPVCRFGLVARGVVWVIIAWFLIRSALMARAGDIHGVDDALRSLRDNAYGSWLLAVVAAGLFAFGVYSVLEALYRRIRTSG